MKRLDQRQHKMSWQSWVIVLTSIQFILPRIGPVIGSEDTTSFSNACIHPAAKVQVLSGKQLATGNKFNGDIQSPVDPNRLEKLASLLRSNDFQMRTTTLTELSELLPNYRQAKIDLGPIIKPLFSLSGWGGTERRNSRRAESFLVWIGRPVIPLLNQRLKSDNAHDRRVATNLLVRIGPPDASLVALLRPLLNDRDEIVRKAAIRGLGVIGLPANAAINDLERLATNDPLLVLRVDAHSTLIQVAGVSNKRVQELATFINSKQDGEARIACSHAVNEIGKLGSKAIIAEPTLLSVLNHKHVQVRIDAATTIGKVGANSPETIAALLNLLNNDPHKEVRRSATGSLCRIGPKAKAAVPALRKVLSGDSQEGWWIAVDALCNIGSPDIVEILIEALKSPDDGVRYSSVKQLGNLGRRAKPAIMALEQTCQQDPRVHVQTAAAEALLKIDLSYKQK